MAAGRIPVLWVLGWLGATVLVLAGPPALAQGQPREAAVAAVDQMSRAAGAPVRATRDRRGAVRFLATAPGAPVPVDRPGTAEERARAFLGSYGAAFGLARGAELATERVSPVDEVGMEHVRFRQTHRGVPVTGGELAVHLRGQGVVAAHGKTLPDLSGVETVPVVTAAEAAALATDALAQGLGVTGAALSEPRLELLNKGLLGDRGFATTLTWFVEARKIDLREYLWIDARAGKVVLQFSQLTDALDRQVFDADDPGDGVAGELPGALVRGEGGVPAVGAAAADANAAYDFSGDTYDYFLTEHGRDSYDGAGASLVSTVRFCPSAGPCPYPNAFWNGIQMVYGEGFPAADDVDAHELTHAVTEHTANLFYYMQSGALSESYSDIFGETVDLLNASGTDSPLTRWQMGEDVPGFGAIRDMSDPTVFGDPGKTSDPEFVCATPGTDAGGVHSNSGVPNKAYYLMVDGDSYNGQNVSGIGLAKAGKVQYRALSQYLLSASDFLDNDRALRQSCRDLVGTAGITEADCTEVEKALDAVEMSDAWPCSPAQAEAPDLCPAGHAPELWRSEDFEETVVGLPACPAGSVPTEWCHNGPSSFLGPFASSGVRSLWGYNRPSTGEMFLDLMVYEEMPPPGARLQFNHSYGFENSGSQSYDGGQVHYTTDGGSTWQEAGALITAGQDYGGTIFNGFGNPLAGQSAFVRDSYGYTATQLDLSTLAGSAFGFGFLIGTDSLADDYGWFVDDLRIYTCATCVPERLLDGRYTGLSQHYGATGAITAGDGFTVLPGEHVTLEAGSFVALGDGFRAEGDLTVISSSRACF